MDASLYDSYRLIDIAIPDANAPVPTIRLAGGDIAGRVLRVTGWPKAYTPRLAYNPNPDGNVSGGYIDAAQTGVGADGTGYACFELPRAIFKVAHAVLAFELLDGGGTTVISSRRIPVTVEEPVVNTDGGEAYDGLSDLHNAVAIAKASASDIADAEAAFSATADKVNKLVEDTTFTFDCTPIAPSEPPTVSADTEDNKTTDGTVTIGNDIRVHVKAPRAYQFDSDGDVEFVDPNGDAGVELTTKTDSSDSSIQSEHFKFTLPKSPYIKEVVAVRGENASATLSTIDGGYRRLILTLPKGDKGDKGEKGEKGNSGNVATTTVAGVVKPDGTTITVTSDGTVTAKATTPIATTSKVGTVKPDGETITVATDGTITAKPTVATTSATGVVKPDGTTIAVTSDGSISAKTATTSAAGVVKPDGKTITVASDGSISSKTATATTSTAGVVKPDGSTITVASDGTITAKTDEALQKSVSENTTAIAQNSSDITNNVTAIRRLGGFCKNVVFIGDSWMDGYYSSAKHVGDSPAKPCAEALGATSYTRLGTSGGGYYKSGDDGTFLNRWNTVSDKSSVDMVIVVGGQNDATLLAGSRSVQGSVQTAMFTLFQTIHKDAPNATIHVFYPLAVGETLNRRDSRWAVTTDPRMLVQSQLNWVAANTPYVRFHKGAYRFGNLVGTNGDAGDSTHLNANGYDVFGNYMANCILADDDGFPSVNGAPDKSGINGNWNKCTIAEINGVITVDFNVSATGTNNAGTTLFKVPKGFRVQSGRFFPTWNSGCFIAWDGDTLSIQGSSQGSGSTIAGTITMLAGC